jgi:shikimate kinase
MMGSGKSAVGRRLAERLGWRFIDTDEEVASAAGLSIPEIFDREGEARFRELERAVLERLPDRGAIVALGGGAVVDPANRVLLSQKGIRVLLEAPAEILAARVGESDERPLLAGASGEARVARLREVLAGRRDAYEDADVRIRTDDRTVEEVCDQVLRALCRGDDS